jgi:hypothetical protein
MIRYEPNKHYIEVIATYMCDGQAESFGAHIIIMAQGERVGPITQRSIDRNNLMIVHVR